MQALEVISMTDNILVEVRKRLSRDAGRQFDVLDGREFEQGVVSICPLCRYQTKKHPKGSAKVFGHLFKCFACNEKRRVE